MLKWFRLLTMTVALGSLLACAATDVSTTPVAPAMPVEAVPGTALADLPGAVHNAGPPLVLQYAGTSLYQPGAVLPSAEGLRALEALADWLSRNAVKNWQFKVNAELVATGVDAGQLAAQRQELLQRFFQRKGLDQAGWSWQNVTGETYQLQLMALPATP